MKKLAFLALAGTMVAAAQPAFAAQPHTPPPHGYDTWAECVEALAIGKIPPNWVGECYETFDNKWRVRWINTKRGW